MQQRIAGYIVGTIALALAGGICLAASLLDRRIARTQRDMAAQQYGDPDQVLDTVERYLEYASRLPGIGSGPLNDVRARKAALRYWQRQYNLLIPQQGDPIATIPADNVALQRIVANAVYRSGRAQAKDKTTILRALDEAINAYLAVLKNVSRRPIEPTMSSDLVADLGFDSLQVLDVIAELEGRFDISIPLENVPATRTVAEVVRQVRRLVEAGDVE